MKLSFDTIILLYRRMPFVILVLAYLPGVFLARYYHNPPVGLILLVILGTGLYLRQHDGSFLVLWLGIMLLSGWTNQSVQISRMARLAGVARQFDEQIVRFSGVVGAVSPASRGQRVKLVNVLLESPAAGYRGEAGWFVYLPGVENPAPGDTLAGKGEFRILGARRNPGEFDFRSYYQRQGIFGRIFQDQDSAVTVLRPGHWTPALLLERIREAIRTRIRRHVDGEVAGLLTALLLGDKTDVDPDIRRAFVDTGVIHVLAVSGLHVGYILMILMALVRIGRLPWGWDRLMIITGLYLYVVLTGAKPSVVRAAVMAGLYVLAPLVNRRANIWNIIAAAALVILLADPTYLSDLGFLLSFSAVISIVFFYNLFEKILPLKLKVSQISNPGVKFAWGLFLVSASAQIGTLPFTAHYFGRIPVIALVANVFIVPLIGLLVGMGIALLALAWIPGIGFAIGNSTWALGKGIITLAQGFSTVPLAVLETGPPGWFYLGGYALGLAGLIMLLSPGYRFRGLVAGLLLVGISTWKLALSRDGLDVIFLDVGQGDAILIRSSRGKTVLIDTGFKYRQQDMGTRVILPALRHLGIHRLNWLVLTHPHSDHIGGMAAVLAGARVDTVWDTWTDYNSWTYRHILQQVSELQIPYHRPVAGMVRWLDPVTLLQVLHPDTSLIRDEPNLNNRSIVLRLVHGRTSFLFTGDLEFGGDKVLLPFQNCLDSDVLKVAHHGAITGTTQALVDLVTPRWAVISVGYKNKFNHPSPLIVTRLKDQGAGVLRTDEQGAIWLHSDGTAIREVKWR